MTYYFCDGVDGDFDAIIGVVDVSLLFDMREGYLNGLHLTQVIVREITRAKPDASRDDVLCPLDVLIVIHGCERLHLLAYLGIAPARRDRPHRLDVLLEKGPR